MQTSSAVPAFTAMQTWHWEDTAAIIAAYIVNVSQHYHLHLNPQHSIHFHILDVAA